MPRLSHCLFWILLPVCAFGQPYGIESRTPNTTLIIDELPSDTPGFMELEPVFPQLVFDRPVLMIEAPDDSRRMFVVERFGKIKTFPRHPDPAPGEVSVFLDVSNRLRTVSEQGLMALAFDPDYAENGEFYITYSYSNGACTACPTRLSRFTNTDPSASVFQGPEEEVILEIPQTTGVHLSGMLQFGPDGMLYMGVGDGGQIENPSQNAQDTSNLKGSILRLDVRGQPDPGLAYRIPPDNPFFLGGPAGESTRKEIYAYGLRNPWRFHIDPLSGVFFCADVGQNTWEEIDSIRPGGNYGWPIREGAHCLQPPEGCPTEGLIDPIAEYRHTEGDAISGGFVYTSPRLPELYGRFIYGDFQSNKVWGIGYDGSEVDGPDLLVGHTGFRMAGFGLDLDGEVYLLPYETDRGIYVMVQGGEPVATDFPTKLSDIPALLAAGAGVDQTTAGIYPYKPVAELWSDGAHKERFIALPHLDRAGYRESGGWDFPQNGLAIKNFLLPLDERDPEGSLKRIETRLLLRRNNAWHGFSYEWNEEETDAVLLTSAKERPFTIIDETGTPFAYSWQYPSRSQCRSCHTDAANGLLGIQTAQLNTGFSYPASGITDNQLRTLEHIQLFSEPLPGEPDSLPRMVSPHDAGQPLESRVKAYLASNCSHCHQPGAPSPTWMDLRWQTPLEEMYLIDADPLSGNLGIPGAKIVTPGRTDLSILFLRMSQRGTPNQMPPLATSRVDSEAVRLIRSWIGGEVFGGMVFFY